MYFKSEGLYTSPLRFYFRMGMFNMDKIIIPEGMDLLEALNNGEYICNNCGAIMDRKEDPEGGCDILVCPNCSEKIDEMDYEYEYDEDNNDNYDDIF